MEQLFNKRLDQTKEEIRLLRVHLETNPEKRKHTLLDNVSFKKRNINYVALSYTWGEAAHSGYIYENGSPFNITRNLTNALDEVIQHWVREHEVDELYLWCDQICINQQDPVEKANQVRMTGQIYRYATEVLVWLPIAKDIRGHFAGWRPWADWHREQANSAVNNQLVRREAMQYSERPDDTDEYPIIAAGDRQYRDLIYASNNIHDIISSPWWSRAFAYQEFLSAERATFLIRGMSAPWQELADLLATFSSKQKDHEQLWKEKAATFELHQAPPVESSPSDGGGCFGCCGSNDQAADRCGIDLPERSARLKQADYLRDYQNRFDSGNEHWPIVNRLLGDKARRRNQVSEQYELLSELLKHSRECQCTDPRDKIYAFLGLATPAYGIVPDYTAPVSDVFMEATKAIILQERRLNILAIAMHNANLDPRGSASSSWVFDGSPSKSQYRKFLDEIKFPTSTCRASKDRHAAVTFMHGSIEVKGIRADRLADIAEDPPYRSYRRFTSEHGRDVHTVKKAKVGDEIWVFLGANEPFTLRKGGSYYMILGHAMIYEARRPSPILSGALIDQLSSGKMQLESIQIA